MFKRFFFVTLLSLNCLFQINTSGRILNQANVNPLARASIEVEAVPNVREDSAVAKNVFSRLKSFNANRVTEKAYLHFDKPYYAAGDTIYFKSYVTLGEQHRLSDLSGVLHVDLINTTDKIDQSIILQLNNGIAWGDFALPDSLPAGNYRVRAYTQWMLNADEDCFFDKTIEVGSLKDIRVPESIMKKSTQMQDKNSNIQFFPEGGGMVAGIRSKVAFKAIAKNGLGIDLKGVILDNENKVMLSFSPAHLGMGYFYLNPGEGKTYKAKLTYTDGGQNIIDLPKPDAQGIVLSVDNDSIPKASVTITANKSYYFENRGKDYLLVIYSGGVATTVTFKLGSPVITMDILKRRLHTGIATITLFSPAAEPLAERLLFIQNYDQLSLDVGSDKAVYAKREKVNVKLSVMNRLSIPAQGHFSVAVTDESKVLVDGNAENTILSNLLLTSDLKGYVEQPNYYFADTSANARNNLDVLMLTQGYRRFEWKRVLDGSYSPPAYQPEKGLEINGMIKNLIGKPINKGTVTLLPSKGSPILTSVSDDKGIFHFQNLVFADTTHFLLSAVNSKGKNSTKITYFNDKPVPVIPLNLHRNTQIFTDTTMAAYLDNAKKDRNQLTNYGRAKGTMLKEVKIRDKKLDDKYRSSSLAGPGHADQVMHADEIEQIGGELSTSMNGRLRGVVFNGGVPFLKAPQGNGPMLVVIDGTEENPGYNINVIPSSEIETVEVLRFANASVYGGGGGSGVLLITTKQGGSLNPKDIASVGILPITPKGLYKSREFYSPKYNAAAALNNETRDLRSTIYWNPEIKTDKNGNANFDFYNADGLGTYKVTIEGIDKDGNIGRQVYRYKVEDKTK